MMVDDELRCMMTDKMKTIENLIGHGWNGSCSRSSIQKFTYVLERAENVMMMHLMEDSWVIE